MSIYNVALEMEPTLCGGISEDHEEQVRYYRFLARHIFRARRKITSCGKKLSPNYPELHKQLMESIRETRQQHNVTMVGNMVETPWWVEPVGNCTVDERGARQSLLELEERKRNV